MRSWTARRGSAGSRTCRSSRSHCRRDRRRFMQGTATQSTDRLIGQLERQQVLVEELWDLARRQGALVEVGDAEGLLTLLAQRQSITDQFLAAQEGMASLC